MLKDIGLMQCAFRFFLYYSRYLYSGQYDDNLTFLGRDVILLTEDDLETEDTFCFFEKLRIPRLM